jgi:AcrR family transcriptional regulator
MSNDTSEPTDRRQQILEAAMRVFSTKGFQNATNKDIADAAGGISPGLIYHYFKDKQDLFMSIIRERAAIIQLADHPEELLELEPHEALTLVGRAYITALTTPGNVAFFRILLGEVFRFPQISEFLYRGAIGRIYGLLDTYLRHQIALGNLRPHDTGIAVRSFMGMFMAHIFLRELFRQPEALAANNEAVVAQVVDTFLHGLANP